MSKLNRSPFDLRSKTINKPVQKTVIAASQTKNKVSPKIEYRSNDKKKDVSLFMDELRNSMLNFQSKIETSINCLHDEFNNNFDQLKNEIERIKVDMEHVKQHTILDSAIATYERGQPLDQTVDYLIKGSAILQFKNNFMSQFESMKNKISVVERSNALIEDMVCNIITSIETFMSNGERTNVVQLDQVACESMDDVKNNIDCLQNEIDRVKIASIADGEKWTVMNRQLHVLSAKFVEFNEKIHKLMIHSNSHERNNIECKEIIDPDTKPFTLCDTTSKISHNSNTQIKHQSNRKPRNKISLQKKLSHRFAVNYDPHDYSRFIRVVLHDTKIYNLDQFMFEFTEHFELFLGRNLVESLNIVTYKMHEGIITSMIITVTLKVPLNYSYIDNFMLPANWCFFPWQIARKQKTRPEENRVETASAKERNNRLKYM